MQQFPSNIGQQTKRDGEGGLQLSDGGEKYLFFFLFIAMLTKPQTHWNVGYNNAWNNKLL